MSVTVTPWDGQLAAAARQFDKLMVEAEAHQAAAALDHLSIRFLRALACGDLARCERAIAEAPHEIARQVRRLVPDRRDPEAFHLAKDEAASRLLALADRIEIECA